MARKPKPDNPAEFKRFLDLAREVGADKPSENFDRVLRKTAERDPEPPPKARKRKTER